MFFLNNEFQLKQLVHNSVSRLRLVGKIEGMTLITLLFIAVPLKHLMGVPEGVKVMGPVHGIAFLTYLIVLIECVSGGGFSKREIMRLTLAIVIPFGPFFNDALLKNHQRSKQVN